MVQSTTHNLDVYQPRNPKASAYYRCVENHFERKMLAKVSICAWKAMNTYLKSVVSCEDAVPGASIAVQTYGDFLIFNPHLHAITTDRTNPAG